jgi:hypothetical protein
VASESNITKLPLFASKVKSSKKKMTLKKIKKERKTVMHNDSQQNIIKLPWLSTPCSRNRRPLDCHSELVGHSYTVHNTGDRYTLWGLSTPNPTSHHAIYMRNKMLPINSSSYTRSKKPTVYTSCLRSMECDIPSSGMLYRYLAYSQ